MMGSDPGYSPVSPERRQVLLTKLVDIVDRYDLFTPAALFLGISKPVSFVGSQLMFLLAPFAGLFTEEATVEDYGHLLSDRSNIDVLMDMLEEREREKSKRIAALKEERKKKSK